MQRVVDEQDLQPHGWVCEACGSPFAAGDVAHGRPVTVNITGAWRCGDCQRDGRPVLESGLKQSTRVDSDVVFGKPAPLGIFVIRYKEGPN